MKDRKKIKKTGGADRVMIRHNGKEMNVTRKAAESVYIPADAETEILHIDGDTKAELVPFAPNGRPESAERLTGASGGAAAAAAKLQADKTKAPAKSKAKSKAPAKAKAPAADGGDAGADLSDVPHSEILRQPGNDVKTFDELTDLSVKDIEDFDGIGEAKAKEIFDFVNKNKK